MDTKHLVEFEALANTENYWQTANDLFISQSSLSKHIMALERELGVTLFQRTTRRVSLTPDGEFFLNYARKINQLLLEYSSINESRRKERSNRIFIASTSQITNYSIIINILTDYKKRNSDCTLEIVLESHSALKKLLSEKKVDFIWIGEAEDEFEEGGIIRIPFLEDPLVIVFSPKILRSNPNSISISELAKRELIIQGNNSIENRVFLKFCQENNVIPKTSFLPIQSIHDFIKHELGIAVVLRSVALSIAGPDLSVAEIENSPIVRVSLAYLDCSFLSYAAKDFLQFLKKHNK